AALARRRVDPIDLAAEADGPRPADRDLETRELAFERHRDEAVAVLRGCDLLAQQLLEVAAKPHAHRIEERRVHDPALRREAPQLFFKELRDARVGAFEGRLA